jgi:hypothetical protein
MRIAELEAAVAEQHEKQDRKCENCGEFGPCCQKQEQGEPVAWEHLKAYGYAPGGYMMSCRGCGNQVIFVDKRASRCRSCAEAAYTKDTHPPQRSEEIVVILRQALEALEDLGMKHYENTGVVLYKEVFTDLRQAIARAEGTLEAEKQERGEPVDLSSFLCGYAQIKDGQYKFANMRTVELLTKDEFGPIYAIPEELIDSLYTHPPVPQGHEPKRYVATPREPLTDEQCLDLAEGCTAQYHDLLALCRAIEAAHGIKEKNT